MRSGATRIASLLLGSLLAAACARGQTAPPSEYQLKAAFLYHFAQFVEWPAAAFPEAGSPLVIGILGENPFGAELEKTMSGKRINQHPLLVKEVRSLAEATNSCHMLFIAASEKKRLPEILAPLGGASILTVGETERFTEAGGIINFVLEGTRIRFQINETAARNARLRISSKLLSLASRTAR